MINASKSCASCGTNVKTCASESKASSCNDEFYLKSDGTCGACPSNTLTCSSDTVPLTCKTGYYLKTDTSVTPNTKSCEACGASNVLNCSALVAADSETGIDECIPYNGTSIFYKTVKGCV